MFSNVKNSHLIKHFMHLEGGLLQAYRIRVTKDAFSVLKRFRQFYFSRPYFKFVLFYLIGKKKKAFHIQNVVIQNCQEPLNISLKNLKHSYALYSNLKNLIPQIKNWIHSKEFQEEYIQNHHPFPPFLNPKQIHYDFIFPEVAWDLNLPLPDNYQFIFLSCHGVGRSAAGSYFLSCGLPYLNQFVHILGNKERYQAYYQFLHENKNHYNIVTFSELRADHQKFIHLLKPRPFLILIRDPISNLKSVLNFSNAMLNIKRKAFLTLQETNVQFLKQYHYPLNDEKIMQWTSHVLEPFNEPFTFQLIQGKPTIIQTEDIIPQNAFQTFQKLAHIFKFNPPQEKNKNMFENNLIQGMLAVCFPIVLRIFSSDLNLNKNNYNNNLDYFDIFVSYDIHWNYEYQQNNQKNFENITSIFNIQQNTVNGLCIYLEQQFLSYIQQDFVLIQKIKNYIENLLQSLKQENELFKQYNYTEKDILIFLKHSPKSRIFLQQHIHERMDYLKNNHPDIVQSWKYYLNFEKMCQELENK